MCAARSDSPFAPPARRLAAAAVAASATGVATAAATVLAVVAATFVAGCATQGAATDAEQKAAAAANARGLGEVADLRAIGGSAVTGKVRVVDRGDGATITVAAFNVPSGVYRITLNRNGNCTSPNGFSAGPAWAPAGSKRPPADLIRPLSSNSSGATDATVHVPGLRATGPDGVAGRSVILYAGNRVTDAQPDVPNERIACGVFEAAQTLQF
ncbi:MAG TPA: hypothetical protein VF428_07735 [Casimicrobiaceae bacterium]